MGAVQSGVVNDADLLQEIHFFRNAHAHRYNGPGRTPADGQMIHVQPVHALVCGDPAQGCPCITVCRIHSEELLAPLCRQCLGVVDPLLRNSAPIICQTVIDRNKNPSTGGIIIGQLHDLGLLLRSAPKPSSVNEENDGSFCRALVIGSVQIEFQRKGGVLGAVPAFMAQAISVDDVFFHQDFPLGICVHRSHGRDGWSRKAVRAVAA